uniref:Uncharacterized protein n=1 Tax=Globisporangium ultimum (strain ATCC 200006 / CBS 805.95 / DAOM BR144) TaxID=431595 RepID=K3WMS9_GLOUD
MKLNFWASLKDTDDLSGLAAAWAELFRAMYDRKGGFTVFGHDMLDALEAHCHAMNALDNVAVIEYMKVVDAQLGAVNDQLAYAERLLKASAGLNVANTVPAAIAAAQFWNPIGWCAGAVSVSAAGASIGCKVTGENALEEVETMLHATTEKIETQTTENAVTRIAKTMEPIAKLLKDKFGEEKANAAYFVLLAALMAYSNQELFDVDAIPKAVTELVTITNSSGFASLLRYVRDASVSPLSPSDAAKKFGSSMRRSTAKLKVKISDKSVSFLSIVTGSVLRPICEKVNEGLETYLLALAGGTISLDAAQLAAKEAEIAMVFSLTSKLSMAFSALVVIGVVVAAGFGIKELIEMEERLKPYKEAIEEVHTNHYVFADAVAEVPRLFRRYQSRHQIATSSSKISSFSSRKLLSSK